MVRTRIGQVIKLQNDINFYWNIMYIANIDFLNI